MAKSQKSDPSSDPEESSRVLSGLGHKLKERWGAKAPIIFFLLGFAVLMGLYYVLYSTQFYQDFIYEPVIKANAFLGSILLNLFGQGTQSIGADISSIRFAISISQGCDGLEPIALFAAALLAYPISFKLKLPGLVAGMAFLAVLNLIRIVTLFLTGVYWRAAFDAMHLEVWQALFLILAVVTWLIWINWATKRMK